MGGRHYLIKGWHNASEYSGEQIGNRLKASVNIYNDDGTANLGAFNDDVKAKPLESDKLITTSLDKLDIQESQVKQEYLDGKISDDKLRQALAAIEHRRYIEGNKLYKADNQLEALNSENKMLADELASGYDVNDSFNYDFILWAVLTLGLFFLIF